MFRPAMFRPAMFKKVIATAGIAASLAVVAPSAANADTGNQYRMLQPGQSACVQDDVLAFNVAQAEGSVYSGHNVRFTFGPWSPYQPPLSDSGSPVATFAAQAIRTQSPQAFPARFQICAYNQSLKVSYVQLRAHAIG
jgi:hypothetical protein